ncbi:methyl-accepting chemotaxis protein [Shinella yambaruensis]|uniref:Methyl-accepting chemotaxis protein n=1 Tax=Shinella yambaruensis TaxID=415996 RepID=A0ABQ5ZL15_9HYPH|nr:HAMP domain-containing methyl-accepting chemotaxis protein [Shinella yambaruensis]MCJ8028401.1 methyl-accepting chemotaxis protein [Shinella yambaruensis]MCU7981454.1 methyl-accepting chemotaxis protein [Shinella yambaruensis]GLR53515.1 methyl-accepting chemotaxis protein [Shinella yambaruensis]
MSIKFKLLGAIAILSAIAIGLALHVRGILQETSVTLDSVYTDRILPLKDLKVISDAYAVAIVDAAHKANHGAITMEDGLASLNNATASINTHWRAYTGTELTTEEASLVSSAQQKLAAADASVGRLKGILQSANRVALDDFIQKELYRSIDPVTATISILSDLQVKQAETILLDKKASFERLETIGSIVIGSVLVIALAFFIFTSRHIVRPLSGQIAAMRRLIDGDLTDDGSPHDRKDEIGEMARAIATFRQAARRNHQLEQEAGEARQRAEAERMAMQEEAEHRAKDMIRQANSELASGLKRLAEGDLAFSLETPFSAEFEALRHDLNSAVGQLGRTLASVSEAIVSIGSGTQEISRGADDLSRQAAALEQTAAALDEITANVTSASRRADEARAVAAQANENAQKSHAVVVDAVDAMRRIEESSNRISSIIGVIDEIAFQTNLLALNAGVEAARAGEAGKGFAVVAQEVRELAQRSAGAAKEIKGLIKTSSGEVEGGVKLVSATGEALKDISEYVATINHHVDAIAMSAREQSIGLQEVNSAVNQMDQVTQENAAMVEETNAASATLADDAARLREMVGQFRLSRTCDAGREVHGLRSIASAIAAPTGAAQGIRLAANGWQEF